MNNQLIAYRYFVFIVFIICSAIVCCTSVWNMSVKQISYQIQQVDVLLIVTSALGMVYSLSIICLDLTHQNAIVCRIWFECMCMGVFWLLHFSAAAALSVALSRMTCSGSNHAACVSTEVVLAFAWMSSFNLMVYLGILLIMSFNQQLVDGQVWQACVRRYDWSTTHQHLGSRASSPIQKPKPFLMSVPRPAAAQTDFSRRMVGDIEKQDYSRADAPQPHPVPSVVSQTTLRPARPTLTVPKTLESSSKSLASLSTEPVSRKITSAATASPSAYSETTHPDSPQSANDESASPRSSSSSTASSSFRSSRPQGRRSPTARRPPPLDLSKITAYR